MVNWGAVMDDSIAVARLSEIRARIEKARKRFGPPPETVTLVAVSKTFDAEAVRPFLEAGQRVFGENRVQEAAGKWPELRAAFPDVELHLIGPLQTNKAREAVALFDVIETVDRDKLAGVLRAEMTRAGRELPVFVQVNIGGEAQKAGIAVGRGGGIRRPVPRRAWAQRCRADVHPARWRAAGAVFCGDGAAGARRRGDAAQHGDERRLRDGDRDGGDPCARWVCVVRGKAARGLTGERHLPKRRTIFVASRMKCRAAVFTFPTAPLQLFPESSVAYAVTGK